MANRFSDLAMRLLGEQQLQAEAALDQTKTQKKQADQVFDIDIAQKQMQLNEFKSVENALKLEEKQEKLNEKLLSQMAAASPGQALVGNQKVMIDQFVPEVEPEAAGLPLVDQFA